MYCKMIGNYYRRHANTKVSDQKEKIDVLVTVIQILSASKYHYHKNFDTNNK